MLHSHPLSNPSSPQTLLSALFCADVHGNGAVLTTKGNSPLRKLLKNAAPASSSSTTAQMSDFFSSLVSESSSPTSPGTSARRKAKADVHALLSKFVNRNVCTDFALVAIKGQCYMDVSHSSVLSALSISLCHSLLNDVVFAPLHDYYDELSCLPSSSPTSVPSSSSSSSSSLSSLQASIAQHHEAVSRTKQRSLDDWTARRPSLKRSQSLLQSRIDSLRKEVDCASTLASAWTLQQSLDKLEVLNDAKRLEIMPPFSTIKLAGSGFKLGTSAIWMENLLAPFAVGMSRSPASTIVMTIGGGGGGGPQRRGPSPSFPSGRRTCT